VIWNEGREGGLSMQVHVIAPAVPRLRPHGCLDAELAQASLPGIIADEVPTLLVNSFAAMSSACRSRSPDPGATARMRCWRPRVVLEIRLCLVRGQSWRVLTGCCASPAERPGELPVAGDLDDHARRRRSDAAFCKATFAAS